MPVCVSSRLIHKERVSKYYSINESEVYLHMAARRSPSATCFFSTKAILITGTPSGKPTSALVSLPSFICSFDHSEKVICALGQTQWSKAPPVLMKENC